MLIQTTSCHMLFRSTSSWKYIVYGSHFITRNSVLKRNCVAQSSSSSEEMPKSQLTNDKGEFKRAESSFRNWVTADGSSGFKAEKDRYHLYVCYACPWASRTLVLRKLKGLDDVITVDYVDWKSSLERGWRFSPEKDGCTPDTVNGKEYLKEIYNFVSPNYEGRVTVPVLFDKRNNTIVSNESSEIIRMFNKEFNLFCKTEEQKKLDFYPDDKKNTIDALNEWIYEKINNGVYRAGFATTQEAYDVAVREVFEGLDKAEMILAKQRFLTGAVMTEADVRLFTTLVRFDEVYHILFKCNKRLLSSYPNLWGHTRDIYQTDGVRDTVNMYHIKHHYMESMTNINPFAIVSTGPDLNFDEPHGRESIGH